LKFDPERWTRDDTHAFAMQPFGFGPRACYGTVNIYSTIEATNCFQIVNIVGRRFAELEMKLLIIQVFS